MVVSRPPAGRDGSGGASKECKFSLFPFFKNSGNRKEEGGETGAHFFRSIVITGVVPPPRFQGQ